MAHGIINMLENHGCTLPFYLRSRVKGMLVNYGGGSVGKAGKIKEEIVGEAGEMEEGIVGEAGEMEVGDWESQYGDEQTMGEREPQKETDQKSLNAGIARGMEKRARTKAKVKGRGIFFMGTCVLCYCKVNSRCCEREKATKGNNHKAKGSKSKKGHHY